jgi:hypothetical protein
MREARRRHSLAVGVASPFMLGTAARVVQRIDCVVPANSPARPARDSSPIVVVAAIARATGISESAMRSRARARVVCSARRYALLVWVHHLARPAIEMANALGISSAAASHHLSKSTAQERAVARQCTRGLTALR